MMPPKSWTRTSTRHWQRNILWYAVAAGLTGAAWLLLALVPQLRVAPFMLFVLSVAFIARFGGVGPSILACVVSVLVVSLGFLDSGRSMPLQTAHLVRIVMFVVTTLLIVQLARQHSSAQVVTVAMRDRFASIVESSEDAILSKDLNGIVASWNPAAEKLYGYTAAEVVGKHVSLLAPPEKVGEIDDIMKQLRAGQKVGRFQTERVRKDGRRLTVLLCVSPVHDAEGNVVGGSALAHDITAQVAMQRELERAQQELALAYARLRLAQTAAHIGTWEWDVESGKVVWSAELEQLHGLKPGAFGGAFQDWLNTVHPEDRETVQKQVVASLQDEAPYDVEYRAVRSDGSVFWVTARGRVFRDQGGAPVKMTGILLDVDARKEAEEKLRRTEKLAATGRLAASIAHEINNPLEAIVNLVYLAKSDATLPPATLRYLELADKELARVAHLAKQTLGYYRDPSAATPLRVSLVLDEVLALYGRRLESKDISLQKEDCSDSEVIGFEGEIRQLFSNLVANAIDALPAHGRLRVRVAATRPSSGRTGVRVTVADNGCGMRREVLARIFEPFYTTKDETGVGLGLWLSQSIAEKHGGRIQVRSSARNGSSGTVFSVFLPHRPAELVRAA